MNIKNLFKEDDAVSPVIGVILMVAITVILAAVIASFVLGLGDQADEVQPNSSFEFDYNVSDGGANELTITLTNGDAINAEDLYLRGSINDQSLDLDWTSDADTGLLAPSGDTNIPSGANVQDAPTYSSTSGVNDKAAGVSGFSGDEVSAGQGIAMYGQGSGTDINSYDLDVVWDTGDDSATLAEDDGEA